MPVLRQAVALFVLTPLLLWSFAGSTPTSAEEEDLKERRARLKRAQTEFDREEAEFVKRVNVAIDKGAAWLAGRQRKDGNWHSFKPNALDRVYPGRAALNMLTLAKCGRRMKDKDQVLKRGLAALETYLAWFDQKSTTEEQKGGHTYSQALLVLMYDALYVKKSRRKPKKNPRRPGGTQAGRPKKKRKNPCKWPKDVAEKVRALVRWIEHTQEESIWRYPGPAAQNQDLSNAQYALLALQAATRCGIKVKPETYRKALTYVLTNQQKRGPEVQIWAANPAWEPGEERYGRVVPTYKADARGWGYMPGNRPTGSMTSAGIACLAIIKEGLRDLGVLTVEERKAIDLGIRDGVGWFSKNFAVDKNPGSTSWHHYYLYGLERAGDLLGLQYMGKHDWYREGADHLLGTQGTDGSWPGAAKDANAHGQTQAIRTCFALLFLKRATVPPSVPIGPAITGG